MSPTSIVAYLLLFGSVGLLFLLVSLLLGRLLRPNVPTPVKLNVYECGEPAVGTSFVQFDLRFYVVALVFIVFEVEVALFFPPATIFGKATHWMNSESSPQAAAGLAADLGVSNGKAEAGAKGAKEPPKPAASAGAETAVPPAVADDARSLALAAAANLAVFFALILLGFAYVWRRGDLEWVRAVSSSGAQPARELQVVR